MGDWVKPSDKVMDATWATQAQGQKALIERFQNSRVNSANVPFECKPVVLEIASTQSNSKGITVADDSDIHSRPCRVNTCDFFDLRAGFYYDAARAQDVDSSSSTTEEPADSETGATSSDTADDASESGMVPACLDATATWPLSRRMVKWCDVTDEDSESEMSPMASRVQRKTSSLTLLPSTFAERAMKQSISVKNTFIELLDDESLVAVHRARFASM